MRTTLASRIIGLAALYCIVFIFLVIVQFSSKGNFTLSTGTMTIRGRYLPDNSSETAQLDVSSSQITGGARVFFEGIEFNLKEERGKGLMLAGTGGVTPVNPEVMLLSENSARFILPGGSAVIFSTVQSPRGTELQVNAEFANNISEITVPVSPRRSSLVRDSGQIGILFSGSRYFLSTSGHELEDGKIILTRDNSFISYRARSRQRVFNPSDYMLTQAQNYEGNVRNWQNSIFTYWNQNVAAITTPFQNENDVIAFMSESIQRGNYISAVNTFRENYRNSPRLTYRSSVYIGRTAEAYPTFIAAENTKMDMILRLIRERSLAIFKEEHILDYLFTRSSTTLANEVIEIINNTEPQMLNIDYCAGLLEAFSDLRRWRTDSASLAGNSMEQLTNQILTLIGENLNRNNENNTIYISTSEGNNPEYNMRLGKALLSLQVSQGTEHSNVDWNTIGKSLVLSTFGRGDPRPHDGRLHNILNPVEYNPRAVWLTDTGHWAWTVSSSARATYIGGNMNIAFSFPVNMNHYVMIRGVRPFIRIQIHGMDWRSDSQFEIYDSSGWVYYPQEQVLVLKLRHRSTVENVRIIYRSEEPLPATTASEGNTVD